MDWTITSSLVDSTFYSLDDSHYCQLPIGLHVLKLLDVSGSLDEEAGLEVTSADTKSIQSNVGNLSVSSLKKKHFCLIFFFDPKRLPSSKSPQYAVHGEDLIKSLSI